MSILAIILLIALGIILFIIEFLIVPGVTIAGIGGFILMAGAVFSAYHFHGSTVGNYTLLGTLLFFVTTIVYVLKSKTWTRAMLTGEVIGKVDNVQEQDLIHVGDRGKTITRLNPAGKAMVNNVLVEARSTGAYMSENTEIEVIKVLNTSIVVKPINNLKNG